MDPHSRDLGWGILGAGGIADSFVTDLAIAGSRVAAVGARSADSAALFATRHGIPRSYGGYDSLVADPDVDIVYIATPAPFHLDQAMLAIAAGKHVLIEKPFALSALEARAMVDAARAAGVFAMEAMWTRFLPTMAAVRDRIANGAIGEVVTVTASHSQKLDSKPDRRQFDPALAGGALFDLGIYPVSLAHHLLGTPTVLAATGVLTESGVDARVSALLDHGHGRSSLVHTSMVSPGDNRATIVGTTGAITLDRFFFSWTGFDLIDGARPPRLVERWEPEPIGTGLRFEALEVERLILAGERESPIMPLDETVSVMATLDDIARIVRTAQDA
jgi:predicted dehydrogenase